MEVLEKKYILYGAGEYGRQLVKIIGREKILFFCDKNAKTIAEIEGIPVYEPERIAETDENDVDIVISTKKTRNIIEIANEIKNTGREWLLVNDVLVGRIKQEAELYEKINTRDTFKYDPNVTMFCTMDKYKNAGNVSSYFWQDLWAAKRIYDNPYDIHYDIGSRLDGFVSHLLAYGQKVRMVDIRPLETNIPGMDFIHSDATDLNELANNSIVSLSALCSLEHFGLGRYGDTIDPEACFKCFDAIQRKMMPGGRLYISVPIGKERLVYNAHRVFRASTIKDAFSELKLVEFSTCCMDSYEEDVQLDAFDDIENIGAARFGLFMFVKEEKK